MNHQSGFCVIALLFSLVCNQAFAARTVCNFNNSTLASNEVLIKAETNLQQCSVAGIGSPTLYTIDNIAVVPVNSFDEKEVCGGWKLPIGYTVKRKANSSKCPNQQADFLLFNNAPTSRSFNYSTAKNTQLSQSAMTTDADNDPLIYSLNGSLGNLQLTGVSQKGGSITLNSATGQFTYTPPANMDVQDFFQIYVFDQKSDPVGIGVYINVGTPTAGNQPPQFDYNPVYYTLVAEMNFKLSFIPAATDPNGDPVAITLDQSSPPLHGNVTSIVNSLNTLVVTYTPKKNFVGTDSVKFIARDTAGNVIKGGYPITVAFIDSDTDGIADWYEKTYQLNYLNADDANYDDDSDGLSSLQEYLMGTSLILMDTDSDGIPDGYEAYHQNFNPLIVDSQTDFDVDGFTNYQEFLANTNPNNAGDTPLTPMVAWLVPVLSIMLN